MCSVWNRVVIMAGLEVGLSQGSYRSLGWAYPLGGMPLGRPPCRS